ncbi:MAG: response regulator [Patescibacteria group bacterium]
MKILVIDDTAANLEAAKSQLAGHEVVTVGSFDEAFKLVCHYDSGWQKENVVDFDAVLIDLMMPAGKKSQGPRGMRFVGEEMPLGIFLALQALRSGVKRVGLLTDTNHHDHPASAALDHLGRMELGESVLVVNNNSGPDKRWDKLLERFQDKY